MRGEPFTAPVGDGHLSGWVSGHGAPVMLLHGGPGLSFEYVDEIADDIAEGYEVAAYQQRGLAPSTTAGPYDVDAHLRDVAAALDALGWQMAFLAGHSWGGHLGLHAAIAMPERLLGALAIDPLGAVGDGGAAAFNLEMLARCPEDVRAKVAELDQNASNSERSDADVIDNMRRYWPAYFARWDDAPPMPPMRISVAAYAAGFESLTTRLPELEAALPTIGVPVGFLAGGASPMPVEATAATAARIPGAWVETAHRAGHFPWVEQPGSVRAALDRLAEG
jgi:proline iminopeptidase